jgi:plastocyanin
MMTAAANRAVLIAAALAVGLCGSAAVAAAPKVDTIVIDKMSFGPAPAEVHVGDKVRWVNRDMFQHSATADDHSFDVDLQPGDTGEAVMKHAGVVTYKCRYHPGMKGKIVVKP